MSFSQNAEKATRIITTILAFSIGVFHLLNVAGVLVTSAMTLRVVHVMTLLMIGFLIYPKNKEKLSKLDIATKIVGILVSLFTGSYLLGR